MTKIMPPAPMNGDEYKAALAHLGMVPWNAGRFLQIGERTSYRYSQEGDVPGATAMLLRVMVNQGLKAADVVAMRPIRGVHPARKRA